MVRLTRALLAIMGFCVSTFASSPPAVTIRPLSYNFGSQYIGKPYLATTISIKNIGSSTFSLLSFELTGPFQWSEGLAPRGINPGDTGSVIVRFTPTVSGPASGSLILNFNSGLPSITVPLSGTGVTTTAAVSYSATELAFPNQIVGAAASQTLTLTNNGKASTTVFEALITPGTFSVSGQTFPFGIGPGVSKSLLVTYAPVSPGTQKGTLSFIFTTLPDAGVGVSGTATAASALTLATTTPILGPATQGAMYSYPLNAAGGTPPYTWSLSSGTLPAGLSLNSQGVIAGTVQAQAIGTQFTVQVNDANGNTASGPINLGVLPPTGANCNDITWDVTGTTSPEVPMDQLGTGTYLGYMGGLYPGGSNTIPAPHLASGIAIAGTIQPLDANGDPSPTGKYAMMSLGTSDASYEFDRFIEYASREGTINPSLVLVEGAMGSEGLDSLLGPDGIAFWNNIYNWALPDAGVTPKQVEVIWMEPEDATPAGPFPLDMEQIQSELLTLIPNLLVRFPNLKLLYLASRTYAGYANPARITTEPYSYDQGYALQAIIADQINGNPALNFDPTVGPVLAPWVSWENYKWGNGMTEHNGLVWACQDFRSDGYHVADGGEDKYSGLMMNFMKTDPTAAPWFYVPTTPGKK